MIKSGLVDLDYNIEKVSEDGIKYEKHMTEKMLLKAFLIFIIKSKKEKDLLKTLTLEQMLSRLPISLAQLKAGNNSEKRNEE